jgi:hypothetical protein
LISRPQLRAGALRLLQAAKADGKLRKKLHPFWKEIRIPSIQTS